MAKKIDVNGLDHYHDKVSAMLASEYSSSKTYAVGDYCFHAGTLYECTTAITTAEAWTSGHWTAAKLADDTSALKTTVDDVIEVVSDSFPVDMSSDLVINGLINTSNKWSTTSGFYSYGLSVNAEQYHSITVTAGENNAIVGILASSTLVNTRKPTYATGYDDRAVITSGTTRTLLIPTDCVYIVITKEADTVDRTPTSVIFNGWKNIPVIDDTLTILGDAADAKATGDKINTIIGAITENEIIDIGSATVIRGMINSSNVWSRSTGFNSYAFNIENGYYKLSVTANENVGTSIGLLKNSDLRHQVTPPYCDGITSAIPVPVGETITVDIPSDCTYVVIRKEYSGNNSTPTNIEFFRWGVSSEQIIPLGLHEMPRSESALNIVKRCRQLTDIKWTPAVDLYRFMLVQRGEDIPDTAERQNYFGTFKAGTEYTGIPYGRVSNTMSAYGYSYATVAHYIPIETFVSSVCNPESKLCKEDVHNLGNHVSVLYATVCSGLTCYALNVPEIATASIHTISGLASVGKINDNGTEIADSAFQIGDVLNLAGYHTAIVTDIIRDNEGTIQCIELSDASTAGLADKNYSDGLIGGVCRRKGWTRDKIYSPAYWGDYTIYRYTGNVPYTPSPYVNIGDEFNMQRIEHFPCMPYEGNKFIYKSGHIPNNVVKILVSLSGYDYLKVFKDGAEISGSPFTVTSETTSIDVSEIGAGVYKAYLCNITDGNVVNLTYPCEWEITE